jgi:hypothetical protein
MRVPRRCPGRANGTRQNFVRKRSNRDGTGVSGHRSGPASGGRHPLHWKDTKGPRTLTYTFKVLRKERVTKDFPKVEIPYSNAEYRKEIAPTNYFMYPYAEADGKPLNEDLCGFNIGCTIRFEEW